MSHEMLELHNVRKKPSNMGKKKSKGITKCEKRTIIHNIRNAQCKDGTVKCEKKVMEPPNVRKELSHMMLELHEVRMEPSNVRKK